MKFRIGDGVNQLLDPSEDGDDAGIQSKEELERGGACRNRRGPTCAAAPREDIGAGIGPVTHACRRWAVIYGGAPPLSPVEELRLVDGAGRECQAQLRQASVLL